MGRRRAGTGGGERLRQPAGRRITRPARSVGRLQPQHVPLQRGGRHGGAQAGGHGVSRRGAAAGAHRRRQLLRQPERRLVVRQQRAAGQAGRGHVFLLARGHQQHHGLGRRARPGHRDAAGAPARGFRPDARPLGCARRPVFRVAGAGPLDGARFGGLAGRFLRQPDRSRLGRCGAQFAVRGAGRQHPRQSARRDRASGIGRARPVHLPARRLPAKAPQRHPRWQSARRRRALRPGRRRSAHGRCAGTCRFGRRARACANARAAPRVAPTGCAHRAQGPRRSGFGRACGARAVGVTARAGQIRLPGNVARGTTCNSAGEPPGATVFKRPKGAPCARRKPDP